MKFPNLQHLRDHKISWSDHGKRSAKWALRMQIAAIKLGIHSLFPWVFVTDASEEIEKLHKEMVVACTTKGIQNENF